MSCVVVTTVPTYTLVIGLGVWLHNHTDFEIDGIIGDIIGSIALFLTFLAFILYILARVFTLALAFMSLRELPHGAFDTIHWTTFIPHI